MTKRPRPVASFVDCTQMMDKAISHGGLRVNFATSGAATRFRQRCYVIRARLRDASAAACPPGVLPHTPYDDIFIQRENEDQETPNGRDTALVFKLRSQQPLQGNITDLQGNQLIETPDFDALPDLTLSPPNFDDLPDA